MSATELPTGLRYSSDADAGCSRRRCGRGFAYYDPKGLLIRKRDTIQRFKALAVPPAYSSVWLCSDPRGHLQATGRDDRGRKQYRYHEAYRSFRDENKFSRMAEFGDCLPAIRRTASRDLRTLDPGDKRYAAALVVTLLDATGFRIGNERYLRENHTRGILTLSRRHVDIGEDLSRMKFAFTAKGGKKVSQQVTRSKLVRCVGRLQELPGQRIFVYRNAHGKWRDLCSEDVSAYLEKVAGRDFSAKDFRTWIGTREAAGTLVDLDPAEASDDEAWQAAIEAAAAWLGNTKAVARKAYVHPQLEGAEARRFLRKEMKRRRASRVEGLSRDEEVLLRFLNSLSRRRSAG